MKGPSFSIFTPVHVWNEDRKAQLLRAIESVKNQTYKNFEHIIINDGSTLDIDIPHYPWLKVLNQPHNERVVAFNLGFRNAKKGWFAVLDSDDEWERNYLEECCHFIKEWPDYKMFNFGCKYIHKDGGEALRDAFELPELEVGHEVFGGGNIVSGTYIWHSDIYRDLGGFPESGAEIDVPWYRSGPLFMGSPYDFSAYAQWEFPEIQQFFQVKHPDHPAGLPKELGNPWGQDYYLFYKYTRKYHSKAILGKHLYVVHPR